MIGTTLDKYEVLQKVGEGGMATVYRGRHRTLNRDVAIKVLHPHLSSSTRNRLRFEREARAIEHLRHDNILEIFDYSGHDAEECYIITEFVEGETLTRVIDRTGRMPSEVVTLIGMHLCMALDYAHRQGILHRDLKPDNVMLRFDGTVKLMDFGIARFLDESHVTMTGALVGSPAFMSPEQAGESVLDQRSDLFSLGTLLFYLVTGHLPFTGSNPSLILKKIIEATRPLVAELAPSMSATLADVIERLLQTSPDERYPSASAILEDLRLALSEADINPESPDWSLTAWLQDDEAYSRRLEVHLSEALLRGGKRYLHDGDHLAALRMFNRLLSSNEENPEVLELVKSLHGAPQQEGRVAPMLAAVAVAVALVAVFLLWLVSPNPEVEATPSPVRPDVAPELVTATLPPPTPTPSEAPVEVGATTTEQPQTVPVRTPPAGATKAVRNPKTPVRPSAAAQVDPPPPPVPAAPSTIEIRANYPARIWVDGKDVGSTRQPEPIQVSAGEHEIVLRSAQVQDYAMLIEVPPGTNWTPGEMIKLLPKPAWVELDARFPPTCTVTVDGVLRGAILDEGRLVRIPHPEHAHTILLECPDGTHERRFEKTKLMGLDPVTFPHP